jgi:hypothetical protein
MTEKLRALHQEWLSLYDHMLETLDPQNVASLFLPTPPPEYDPRRTGNIL